MIVKILSSLVAASVLVAALSRVEVSYWEPPVVDPAPVEKVEAQAEHKGMSPCMSEAEESYQQMLREAGY